MMRPFVPATDIHPGSTEQKALRVVLRHRAARLIRSFVKSRRNVTVFDQVLVSGSNFLTGVMLVRALGLAEFGRFTIAYSVLLLANSIQLSFIASPMMTLGALCSTQIERHRFVRGMFGAQAIFCFAAAIFALAGACASQRLNHGTASVSFVLPFTVAIVAYLMQDWLRRYYFTLGRFRASLCNDAISYGGQVALLALLWTTHRLTMSSALWSVGLTSGLAFVIGSTIDRLSCTKSEVLNSWRRSRAVSFDLGISNQLQWLVYQGAMLIGAGVVGTQAAGGVRATQNIVGPVNVAYQALENLVPLRAAEEMRRGGMERASRFLLHFGTRGFICLLVFFSVVAGFADRFLDFFYGHQLHAYAAVLDLQMLYFLLAWPLRQLAFLFRTIRQTRPILHSSITAAAVSLGLVFPCVIRYGALGIMLAAVSGQVASLIHLSMAWVGLRATHNRAQLAA